MLWKYVCKTKKFVYTLPFSATEGRRVGTCFQPFATISLLLYLLFDLSNKHGNGRTVSASCSSSSKYVGKFLIFLSEIFNIFSISSPFLHVFLNFTYVVLLFFCENTSFGINFSVAFDIFC